MGVLNRGSRIQMPDLPPGSPQEAPVRGEAHENLSNSQGDGLGIGGLAPGASFGIWQQIIGCTMNDGAEGVEAGQPTLPPTFSKKPRFRATTN
jgi:hypothetical protein